MQPNRSVDNAPTHHTEGELAEEEHL